MACIARKWRARWLRDIRTSALVLVLSGCANMYIDGNTKEIPVSQFTEPTRPVSVQVFFEFQTKGVPNVNVTALLKPAVVDQIGQSGLFSAVSEASEPGSGMLNITMNNVPLTEDAFTKGIAAGLTFGLAGSQVSDGYVCSAKFTPPSGRGEIVKSARHAIHSTIGAASPPPNSTKVADGKEAIFTVTRQVLSQVLYDLSRDPAFNP